jgi:hypothetical protein
VTVIVPMSACTADLTSDSRTRAATAHDSTYGQGILKKLRPTLGEKSSVIELICKFYSLAAIAMSPTEAALAHEPPNSVANGDGGNG